MGQPANEENPHQLQQLIRLPGQQYERSPACITTATAIMTRCRGGNHSGSDWAEGGMEFLSVSAEPVQYIDSMGLASKYGHLNNGDMERDPTNRLRPIQVNCRTCETIKTAISY